MKIFLFTSLIIFLVGYCQPHRHETGHFPEKVVAFEAVNSSYDDYNSTAPFIYMNFLFHFSTNRESKGGQFDITGDPLFIDWNMTSGELEIGEEYTDDRFDYLEPLFDTVNTSSNEFGPYSMGYRNEVSDTELHWIDLVMYANNPEGHFDIRFTFSDRVNTTGASSTRIASPAEINYINTPADELYPSFFGEGLKFQDSYGVDTEKIKSILYCSNIQGQFDLFTCDLPPASSLISALESERLCEFEPIRHLNSKYQDLCPYVNGNLLVFCSNRDGGYGGYDLYYSQWDGEGWSEPVNFGESVNTRYDEFRPITLHVRRFDNNLMIFSSNRTGGKGGFDLYYTGIPQMID